MADGQVSFFFQKLNVSRVGKGEKGCGVIPNRVYISQHKPDQFN
jgi:hypothetical protein